MRRLLLVVEPARKSWRFLRAEAGPAGGEEYVCFSGESLAQWVLKRDRGAMVFARGPMPFLGGNKATVGYLSPLTGLAHYSFVGGRLYAEIFDLGLDAVVLTGEPAEGRPLLTIRGRAPEIEVRFEDSAGLAGGARSSYYQLLREKSYSDPESASILTTGKAAELGMKSACLTVEGLFHAGRGGAGHVFARFARAAVFAGRERKESDFLGERLASYRKLADSLYARYELDCRKLSRPGGGTIAKMFATGRREESPTMPARNALQVGYDGAAIAEPSFLEWRREGRFACFRCPVACRHYHTIEADYAPAGRDRLLDDFEPSYAVLAMLDLKPEGDSFEDRKRFLDRADRLLFLEIEELGLDAMDTGLALAALFEGLEEGVIPKEDMPEPLRNVPLFGRMERAHDALVELGKGAPGLRALGEGPEGLVARYPGMRERVFTCGERTMGNAGHANRPWTFLMNYSRFFGHYSGQFYKLEDMLPEECGSPEAAELVRSVVRRMIERECFVTLGNCLSLCAFTSVVFSEGGKGQRLSRKRGLAELLRLHGTEMTHEELVMAAQHFFAQSMAFKCELGWSPDAAARLPARVFEVLSKSLGRPPEDCRAIFSTAVEEWKRQVGDLMRRYGLSVPWEARAARA